MHQIWELYKKVAHTADPLMDMLIAIGMFRPSKRRNKPVVNEKFWPKMAAEAWHLNRYSRLLTKLPVAERNVLDCWMQGLVEAQQLHFKVSVANMAYGVDAAEEAENIATTLIFLSEMAHVPDDDQRTAKADARDFIKDPPSEYGIVWLQNLLGQQFTDPAQLRQWLVDNWATASVKLAAARGHLAVSVDQINNAIGQPANAATGTPATGLVAHSEDIKARMAARLAASRR